MSTGQTRKQRLEPHFSLDFSVRTTYYIYAYKKGGEFVARPRGRPRSENPMSERFFIRVTPQEKEEIFAFARDTGYSLLGLLKKGIEAVQAELDKK